MATNDMQGSSTEGLDRGSSCDGTYQAEMSHVNNTLQKAVIDIPNTTSPQYRVYRVQGLPLNIDIKQAGNLISTLFRQEGADFVPEFRSFAQAIDGCAMVATMASKQFPQRS